MPLEWFNAREAVEIGTELADQFTKGAFSVPKRANKSTQDHDRKLAELLEKAERVRSLRLNFYKRVKFASSFKWRLIENGIEGILAAELTQSLLLHLSISKPDSKRKNNPAAATSRPPASDDIKNLYAKGNKCLAQGNYVEALGFYRDLLALDPNHPNALNNTGVTLSKLGRYRESEVPFREAARSNPNHAEALCNLGILLRIKGHLAEAEISLRRALELKPSYIDARINLGAILILVGRLQEAKSHFQKVLRRTSNHPDALFGIGQIARMEGRFEEAETSYKRVVKLSPKTSSAWAALAGIRKLTVSDSAWLARAEELASRDAPPLQQAEMRFAIGKYYDDVKAFQPAFQNYNRANELLKLIAEPYQRDKRKHLVNELIRVYSTKAMVDIKRSGSESTKPIFVVGMMRSGTSLAEQIIASHPSAKGAGELPFWVDAMRDYATATQGRPLDEPSKKRLADEYLQSLTASSVDALHIVDKAPINSDYLGVIHSVFPKARMIYMRRDPIDTCLSCYFQNLSPTLNFTMDLSDLAHYYREHQRLITHWRAVLPSETILDVPYEELVADQTVWTRKILDFLELEWDERCLDFQNTKRPVLTASSWQVRQKIYKDSVQRWRNYEKFIEPLLNLRD
jgi:tetratricopeptide (TPR) repeat protein